MTVEEIRNLNEKFQKGAVQISELTPSGRLTDAASVMIRSARRIDATFGKLLSVGVESRFNQVISQLEEEMDEIIFILDQLDLSNKKQKITSIDDFVKQGYDLLSVYSVCVDQVIKKRVMSEE